MELEGIPREVQCCVLHGLGLETCLGQWENEKANTDVCTEKLGPGAAPLWWSSASRSTTWKPSASIVCSAGGAASPEGLCTERPQHRKSGQPRRKDSVQSGLSLESAGEGSCGCWVCTYCQHSHSDQRRPLLLPWVWGTGGFVDLAAFTQDFTCSLKASSIPHRTDWGRSWDSRTEKRACLSWF